MAARIVRVLVVLLAFALDAGAQAPSRILVRNPSNLKNEFFGTAAAGVGSSVVVSAPGIVGKPDGPPGRVDVLDAATGGLLASIPNPTPSAGDAFGAAVADAAGNILVGAPYDDTAASNAGAAYLFDVTGTLLRTFTLPGAVANQFCGYDVGWFAGNVLLLCQGDTTYLLDSDTGAILQTYDDPSIGYPFEVGVLGGDVLVRTFLGVYRLDGVTGLLEQTYTAPAGNVQSFTTVGANLLIGSNEIAYLLDGTTGALLHTFVEPIVPFASVRFGRAVATNADRIAIAAEGAVYVYDAVGYSLLEVLTPIVSFGTLGYNVAAYGTGFVVQDFPPGAAVTGGVQLLDVCGNGFVANTESCDDGNRLDGDGCSARCRLEPCAGGPLSGCFVAGTGRSKLKLYEEYSLWGEKDRLAWKWSGTGGTIADLGDPMSSAASTLCVWDRGNTVPRLLMDLDAPPGRTCAQGLPCWKRRGSSGFRRTDPTHNPDGLSRVTLRSSGSSVLDVVGLGPFLGLPEPAYDGPFPFDGTVLVQLVNSETGACWEARYSTPSRNDHRSYRAKSD